MKLIFTRGTFREKLFSSMLFTTLTTLMLCSSLLLIVFSSRMEDSARQEADTLISVVSSSLSDLRDSTEKIGSKLNRNSLVINAMSGGGAFPQQTYYELYNATSGLRDYVQFYLYDTNGALQYSTSSAGHSRTLPTNWGILLAAASHHGELVFRGADAFSYPDRDAVLYAARSIVNNSGDAVGYFVTNLSEDNLQELLEGKFGSRNTLYITDAFMRTIYCSRPAETDSPVPALRSAMLSNTPVSSDEYNYYMRHEPTSGLYIILRQPKAFTRDTTRLLRTVASFLVLGSIALCVFVSFNLSRQLSDPIGKITSAMAEVEKGSLDTRVNLHRSDELGQLADNFDNMVERLKTYMDKLIQGQRDLDEAQIRMMQAQLNPHFLCNTLDTMKWIGKMNGVPEISNISMDLADILRACISTDEFVLLGDELELLNRYNNFYLYEESVILEAAGRLKANFPGAQFLYSMKCNPAGRVLDTVFSQGFGTDAASLGEVIAAGEHGVPAGLIYFSAPGRTEADLRSAWGRCVLIADSLHEVDMIRKIAAEKGVHFLNAAEFVTADPADSIHMNEQGHAETAARMCAAVKEILG